MAGEYADEGWSGTNLNRPDWKRLLADAEAGLLDVVCVTYMSRLGRGNAFIIAEYELGKHGVRVEMVREKFTDDLAGYMGKTMTTMMDGVYPKMVSQWTKAKMQIMVERGYHCGGHTPFGYRSVVAPDAAGFHNAEKEPPKRLVPDEETRAIVADAFAVLLESRSIAAVREHLTAVYTEGHPGERGLYRCPAVRGLAQRERARGDRGPCDLGRGAEHSGEHRQPVGETDGGRLRLLPEGAGPVPALWMPVHAGEPPWTQRARSTTTFAAMRTADGPSARWGG
jgi:DNA invertase Pin-like site-specific DNA recombinase